MNDVLVDDANRVPAPYFLQTHTTNPLLRPETVERAIQAFFEGLPNYDSLFSVTRRNARFWTDNGKPLNHDPENLLRTQDLTPVFERILRLCLFRGSTPATAQPNR